MLIFRTCAIGFFALSLQLSSIAFGSDIFNSFDWDNNVINMPTRLIMYHRETHESFHIPTDAFAILRDETERARCGLEMYELRPMSFVKFEDDPLGETNHFLEDLVHIVTQQRPERWQGPKWAEFVKALGTPEGAGKVSIVTARNQSSKIIFEGLKFLQSQGLIANTPDPDNIWAVGGPAFISNMKRLCNIDISIENAVSKNSSLHKAKVIKCLLDKISSSYPSDLTTKPVWIFSDDDLKNIQKVAEALQESLDSGKWNNIEIQLQFTGPNAGKTFPHSSILRPKESPISLFHTEDDLKKTVASGEEKRVIPNDKSYKINTSNMIKIKEFQDYLGRSAIFDSVDIADPASDPITVVRHKASKFNHVVVDSLSLEIEGERIGVNIQDTLKSLKTHIGKKAKFICMLGVREDRIIKVFRGEIDGTILEPKGSGFGFLPYFLPNGAKKTLGEDQPDKYNPRYLAVQRMIENEPFVISDAIAQ
jgi:inosine/xanthosine triphosphate pyrophosphatase family protein